MKEHDMYEMLRVEPNISRSEVVHLWADDQYSDRHRRPSASRGRRRVLTLPARRVTPRATWSRGARQPVTMGDRSSHSWTA